jgi:hypothetical protein
MTVQIKYLVFKGIAKKEQILFKSFLNLAKNELPYQVVILKSKQLDSSQPDIVIMDEAYVLEGSEASMLDLPSMVVGDDRNREHVGYLSRPIQWSEFKLALINLNVEVRVEGDDAGRLLPEHTMRFVIEEISDSVAEAKQSPSSKPTISDESGYESDYEGELDKLSADCNTYTNREYINVVDAVAQCKEEQAGQSQGSVALMSDDESSSSSAALVLETPSMDVWDDNELEFSESSIDRVVLHERAGFKISPVDEYWTEDNEIIVDNESFLFIKPVRKMVYSDIEPGRWSVIIARQQMTKVPLHNDWQPAQGLNVYPMSSFIWVNTMVCEAKELFSELDEDTDYLLERWPHFTLLELDNVLLKLCTMLFVRPESLQSLSAKSGYGRSTIIGLMNACYKLGYLKLPEDIGVDKLGPPSNNESVLGKFKEVFR